MAKRGPGTQNFRAVLCAKGRDRIEAKRRCAAASLAFKAKGTLSLDVNATPREADRSEKRVLGLSCMRNELQYAFRVSAPHGILERSRGGGVCRRQEGERGFAMSPKTRNPR